MKVILSHFYNGKGPGDKIEVDDTTGRVMIADGQAQLASDDTPETPEATGTTGTPTSDITTGTPVSDADSIAKGPGASSK